MSVIADFFRELAAEAPRWNFIWMYDERQANRVLEGIGMTIQLAVACVFFSLVIGVVGAWAQGARSAVLRALVQGYIQFFRNTPPFVQLLFFYFALGQFTPTYSPDGWLQQPVISNVGWAIISLSFFAGAFNVEIFRAGIEAVPRQTVEAAEALGYSRLKAYLYIILPLAFRISLPALNNNLVNLVKTTTISYAIAVPEMLYVANQIWSDEVNVPEMMNVLLIVYVALVGLVVLVMNRWERAMKVPGWGIA